MYNKIKQIDRYFIDLKFESMFPEDQPLFTSLSKYLEFSKVSRSFDVLLEVKVSYRVSGLFK